MKNEIPTGRDVVTFTDAGDFKAWDAAVRHVEAVKCSIAPMQKDAAAGVMYGDFAVQKWRNLGPTHRSTLHALVFGDYRNGPLTLRILPACPPAVAAALEGA